MTAPTYTIAEGHCVDELDAMEVESVQCLVTSPPYYQLRRYGVEADWPAVTYKPLTGVPPVTIEPVRAELGLEKTIGDFVGHVVHVFRAVRRVLRRDGTAWLNMGDTYSTSWSGTRGERSTINSARSHEATLAVGSRSLGIPRKNVGGIPWRVALALQADGWILRSEVIWHKPSAMPECLSDRPSRAHEAVFLLTRGPRYYYDADAISEPVTGGAHSRGAGVNPKAALDEPGSRQNPDFSRAVRGLVDRRNKRSVWTIQPEQYAGKHFATYPPRLVEPCILAGTRKGDVVLDPFCGTGTTGLVALHHDRSFVGVELNADYAAQARERIERGTAQGRLLTPAGDTYRTAEGG